MEEVIAVDDRTVLIRWSQPFPDAGTLNITFSPLPAKLLEARSAATLLRLTSTAYASWFGTGFRPTLHQAMTQRPQFGRNVGIGNDFFSLSLRLSRAFALGKTLRLEGQFEAFNLTNRVNNLTLNTNFGAGLSTLALMVPSNFGGGAVSNQRALRPRLGVPGSARHVHHASR